jgi:hypothetical protein
VLHGGGNTSVKTTLLDDLGESPPRSPASRAAAGTSPASSRPGLPAVRLAELQALLRLPALGDEAMVRALRVAAARPRRAEPLGRGAAARLPAPQVHRPLARGRGARGRRSARGGARCARDVFGARLRGRPLRDAGLRAREAGGRGARGGAGLPRPAAARPRAVQLRGRRPGELRAAPGRGDAGRAVHRPGVACDGAGPRPRIRGTSSPSRRCSAASSAAARCTGDLSPRPCHSRPTSGSTS